MPTCTPRMSCMYAYIHNPHVLRHRRTTATACQSPFGLPSLFFRALVLLYLQWQPAETDMPLCAGCRVTCFELLPIRVTGRACPCSHPGSLPQAVEWALLWIAAALRHWPREPLHPGFPVQAVEWASLWLLPLCVTGHTHNPVRRLWSGGTQTTWPAAPMPPSLQPSCSATTSAPTWSAWARCCALRTPSTRAGRATRRSWRARRRSSRSSLVSMSVHVPRARACFVGVQVAWPAEAQSDAVKGGAGGLQRALPCACDPACAMGACAFSQAWLVARGHVLIRVPCTHTHTRVHPRKGVCGHAGAFTVQALFCVCTDVRACMSMLGPSQCPASTCWLVQAVFCARQAAQDGTHLNVRVTALIPFDKAFDKALTPLTPLTKPIMQLWGTLLLLWSLRQHLSLKARSSLPVSSLEHALYQALKLEHAPCLYQALNAYPACIKPWTRTCRLACKPKGHMLTTPPHTQALQRYLSISPTHHHPFPPLAPPS